MALVTKISCRVETGGAAGAGTDGYPYLGIGGREFRLDTSSDDFETGAMPFTYIFGEGANVRSPEDNDPRRNFVLDTNRLDGFPVYIRFEPENAADRWKLSFVQTLVYEQGDSVAAFYFSRTQGAGIWLGRTSGTFLHLTKFEGFGDDRLLSMAALR